MGCSQARCQRVGCGEMTNDRRRRMAFSYSNFIMSSLDTQWAFLPLQVDVVLCDACALALGAMEIPKTKTLEELFG